MEVGRRKFKRIGKVYFLSGPDGKPFYVGCTLMTIETRLRQHIVEATNDKRPGPKKEMIRALKYEVSATILELVPVKGYDIYEMCEQLRKYETAWIYKLLSEGHELTNKMATRRANKPLVEETVGLQVSLPRIPKSVLNKLKTA